MTAAPIRVGIVGANAQRGWARDAHLPALRQLSGDYVLQAVSARTPELAEQARAAFGAKVGFGDSLELVRSPDIDLVTVAVKVPEHRAIVLAALQAGKHVYCEWPLGRDLDEAVEMQSAVGSGTHAMIGLQGLSAPAVRKAVALVQDGAIGRPLSLRVFSPTAGWGEEAPPFYEYLQDRRNGATLETIAGGHTLAVMEALVGRFDEIDARSSILRRQVRIRGEDRSIERTSADHMMVLGRHHGGCVSTLEVVGGTAARPFLLELTGEQGWLRIGGDFAGGYQGSVLGLESSAAVAPASEPDSGLVGPPANLHASYKRLARDIRDGTYTVPDFTTAVGLSRLLDQVEQASSSGLRIQGAAR